jgi:hypothetical protein
MVPVFDIPILMTVAAKRVIRATIVKVSTLFLPIKTCMLSVDEF